MKIINLTPHDVTIINEDNKVTIAPSGIVARVSAKTVYTGEILNDLIPISKTEYGEIENLPDPIEDTCFIVSSLVAQRVRERTDIFIPNESVRDDKGRIIGCKSLGRI